MKRNATLINFRKKTVGTHMLKDWYCFDNSKQFFVAIFSLFFLYV